MYIQYTAAFLSYQMSSLLILHDSRYAGWENKYNMNKRYQFEVEEEDLEDFQCHTISISAKLLHSNKILLNRNAQKWYFLCHFRWWMNAFGGEFFIGGKCVQGIMSTHNFKPKNNMTVVKKNAAPYFRTWTNWTCCPSTPLRCSGHAFRCALESLDYRVLENIFVFDNL